MGGSVTVTRLGYSIFIRLIGKVLYLNHNLDKTACSPYLHECCEPCRLWLAPSLIGSARTLGRVKCDSSQICGLLFDQLVDIS